MLTALLLQTIRDKATRTHTNNGFSWSQSHLFRYLNTWLWPIVLTVALMLQCCVRRRLSMTLCIVAKRCVLEQELLLTAYRRSRKTLRHIRRWISRKSLEIEPWGQRTIKRKWLCGIKWSWTTTSRDPERSSGKKFKWRGWKMRRRDGLGVRVWGGGFFPEIVWIFDIKMVSFVHSGWICLPYIYNLTCFTRKFSVLVCQM